MMTDASAAARAIALEGVKKAYRKRGTEVNALAGVDLGIGAGEFVVIRGPSGCGKTTLLMAVAGMLRPSAGRVTALDEDLYAMGPRGRARFRAANIGFVFQMFHLVPYLTLEENVLFAGGMSRGGGRKEKAAELVARMGLAERARHLPGELSAGEKQRAALARALFNDPRIILADEPTGNLDPDNAHGVLERLAAFRREGGTVLLVTHGSEAAGYADRVIRMDGGRIVGDGRAEA